MKVIIAGTRSFTDYRAVVAAVELSGWGQKITQIVSGCAKGVDALGERYASINNIDVRYFPAEWVRNGPHAGPMRNREMAEYADALIALWDGRSPGTANMISEAAKHGLQVFIFPISGSSPADIFKGARVIGAKNVPPDHPR